MMRNKSKILHIKYLKSGIKARTMGKKPTGTCTQRCTVMDGDSWQGNSNTGWKEQQNRHLFQSLKSSGVNQVAAHFFSYHFHLKSKNLKWDETKVFKILFWILSLQTTKAFRTGSKIHWKQGSRIV